MSYHTYTSTTVDMKIQFFGYVMFVNDKRTNGKMR